MPVIHRNFKAFIFCETDRKILEEYEAGPDPEDESVYTCWVASEAGKRFTVHWENLGKDEDNKGVIYVDGVEANFYVNAMASNKGGASSGVKLASGELKPFSFSDVVLTDDDSYLGVEQTTNADELGNITLKIYPVYAYYEDIRHPHRFRMPRERPVVSLYDGAIHETTKRICDHRITLGDAEPFGRPSVWPRSRRLKWEPRDHKYSTPIVVFRFKYRPKAYLQAQGIIPKPAHVEATPQRPIVGSDYYERKELGDKRKRALADQDHSRQNVRSWRSDPSLPLFLPSPSREPSLVPDYRNILHAPDFGTPLYMLRKEDSSGLRQSEKNSQTSRNESTSNPPSKRAKLEPMVTVKIENGFCFWVDEHGVIDLTIED